MAIIEPNTGIRCKKTPARLAPIIPMPFIQKKNDASPGNITTQDNVKINGFPRTMGNWLGVKDRFLCTHPYERF